MPIVIKRSGREEDFDIEKTKNSMAAASDELHQPLGGSDIHILANDLWTQIEGRDRITSKELYDQLVNLMHQRGYVELADAYVKSSSNFWG